MKLALLYSGGKDSSFAALLLDTFYDVALVTAHFGATKNWIHARNAAAELGYAFGTLELDRETAAAVTAQMAENGYPRGGIQHVHEHALEAIYGLNFGAVAGGTHRDDRVLSISRIQAQSLENRHDVDYPSPLSGFDRDAVDRLVESHLNMKAGPFEEIPKADYKGKFRHLIIVEHGQAAIDEVSPNHIRSYIHSRR